MKARHNLFATAVGLFGIVFLTGCFDTKEEYTINPDGSGKVVHECRYQFTRFKNDKRDLDASLRDSVREVIEKAKGVEAWRDVNFRIQEDGRFFFRGTAYFRHLSELDICGQSMMQFDWVRKGSGIAVLSSRTGTNLPVIKTNFSAGDLAEKIKEIRTDYQGSKVILNGMLGNLRQEVILHFSGTVGKAPGFEQVESNILKLKFDGAKAFTEMDKHINDDAWLKNRLMNAAQTGGNALISDEDDNIFGKPAKAEIKITPTPVFEYAAEVALAKAEFATVRQKLGEIKFAEPSEPKAPPARGEPLKDLRVTGVRLVKKGGQQWNSFGFPSGELSPDGEYTLMLQADFRGAVQSFAEGIVENAIASDGSSLLPDSAMRRKIMNVQPAGRTSGVFVVPLKLPGPAVNSLKEISGRLEYSAAIGVQQIDLDFKELKTAAKSARCDAEIQAINGIPSSIVAQEMQLKLNIRRDRLTSVSLVADGQKTRLEQRSYLGGSESGTYVLRSSRPFPPKGRLVIEVFETNQMFTVPFKLENVTLLGDVILPDPASAK